MRRLRSFHDRHEVLVFVLVCALCVGGFAALVAGTSGDDTPPANAPTVARTAPARTVPAHPATTPTRTTRTATTTTATAQATTTPTVETAAPAEPLQIDGAELVLAETPTGRAANRSRLTVQVQFVNPEDRPLFTTEVKRPVLFLVNGTTVSADGAALELPEAFALDEPLEPGASRRGELRFELAGDQTTVMMKERPAQLRLYTGGPNDPLRVAVHAALA